jgi:hypothetical protein
MALLTTNMQCGLRKTCTFETSADRCEMLRHLLFAALGNLRDAAQRRMPILPVLVLDCKRTQAGQPPTAICDAPGAVLDCVVLC